MIVIPGAKACLVGLNRLCNRFLRRKPTSIAAGVERIQRGNGQDLAAWMDLIDIGLQERAFDAAFLQVLENHGRLGEDHAFLYFAPEILRAVGVQLADTSAKLSLENYSQICEAVMTLLVKHKAIYQCRDAHTEGGYYASAEPEMDWQWERLIHPVIKDFDFTTVLELAPGHGRNTNKLRELAKEIILVDVNETCIDACRTRFGNEKEGCKFRYAVNDGSLLPMVSSGSVTTVYSFDSMVHFDKTIVRDYLSEFKRILAPGGKGFLHHSNYGATAPNSDWAKNLGNRSDMSADLFRTYAEEVGLLVIRQIIHGRAEGRGIDDLDCVSVIQQPSDQ